MSFIRQVRQIGKPSGSGGGRVIPRDTIANQPHAFDNKYTVGSGIGATSASNRRALMRRAYRYIPSAVVPSVSATLSTFTVASSKTVGNSDFFPSALPTPTAPYIGTGAITYSSSNESVATINANTGLITIVAAGTVTFTATQAADSKYLGTTVSSNQLTVVAVSLLAAPTGVSGVGGDSVAYILFTAPSATGKPAITNYEYSVTDNNAVWPSFIALSPAQIYSPLTIHGLTNGITYTIKLRAVNSDGAGDESAESSAFTPGTNTLHGTNRLIRLEADTYSGSGTTWTNMDSAGSYSATLLNGPTYQTATLPKYFTFDGNNQIAQIAAASAINPTTSSDFTLQIWARVDKTSANFANGDGLISKQFGLTGGYDGYSLALRQDGSVYLNMNGGIKNDSYSSVTNVYPGGEWALFTIVVRFGGGSNNPSYTYINGRRVATGDNAEDRITSNQAPLQFPRGIQESTYNYAPADVGAFYVYNSALSQETIIRNFDATKSMYGILMSNI